MATATKGKNKIECSYEKLVDIDELVPNPRNPNKHPQKQLDLLAKIIKTQGWRNPIVVSNRSGFIVKGHARLIAVRMLGQKECPVDFQDYESEAMEWADMVADNRLAELAETDLAELKGLLEELNDGEFDLDLTGWDEDAMNELLSRLQEPKPGLIGDDEVPENSEPVCKLGELWQLGDHRLLCGDATEQPCIDRLLDGGKADMVLTDPPYGISLSTEYSKQPKGSKRSALKGKEPKMHDYPAIIGDDKLFDATALIKILGDTKEQFWFGADYYRRTLSGDDRDGSYFVWDKRNDETDSVFGSGFELIWSKQAHKRVLLRFYWTGVFGDKEARNRIHPTQKPTALIAEIILRWGKQANIIIDPFGGSGSTLIACEKLNRRCFMMEIEPHYCDVIIKRWEQFTGKRAVKLNGQ